MLKLRTTVVCYYYLLLQYQFANVFINLGGVPLCMCIFFLLINFQKILNHFFAHSLATFQHLIIKFNWVAKLAKSLIIVKFVLKLSYGVRFLPWHCFCLRRHSNLMGGTTNVARLAKSKRAGCTISAKVVY